MDSGIPTPPGPRTDGRGWAIAGLVLMSISILGIFRVVRGVEGALMAVGEEAAHDAAKTTAYFRGVGINLAAWTGPGLIGLVLVSVALMSKGNRERWFIAWGLFLAFNWLIFFFPFGIYLAAVFLLRWKSFLPPATSNTGTSTI